MSVSYSKTEASGQPTFTLQDHDFKATGWKTIIAYDEIHTNKVLKQFFIISLLGENPNKEWTNLRFLWTFTYVWGTEKRY